MIDLLIVDDEPIIREGLSAIAWHDHGIRLLGAAADSDEALAMARRGRPQIVLTDIRMPAVDGIELSRIIREELPDTRIIVLTGHGSLDYARAAIRLGVSEFLLKPTDPPTVIAAVLKAKRAIQEEERRKDDSETTQAAFVEQRLQQLADGAAGGDDAAAAAGARRWAPLEAAVVVLLGGPDLGPLPEALRERLRAEVCRCGMPFLLRREGGAECMVVDLSGSPCEPAGVAAVAVHFLERESGCEVRAGFAHATADLSTLRCAAVDARLALDAAWLTEGRQAVSAAELPAIAGKWDERVEASLDALAEALSAGESGRMRVLVAELAGALGGGHAVLPRLAVALVWRSRTPLDLQRTVRVHEVIGETARGVFATETGLERVVALLSAAPRPGGTAAPGNAAVRRALAYIAESYAADASLGEAARYCCLHPVYLGRLIRRETGKTFMDLLTETRLEQACRLLRGTDARVYEVAERVGFTDPRYFSDLFKQRLLVTPQEYRRQEASRP